MKYAPLLAAAVAVALTGCDGKSPAGAAVGASDEQKSAITQNLDRLQELSAARQKGATAQTPLLPLLVDAVRPLVTEPADAATNGAECYVSEDINRRTEALEQLRANGIDPASIPADGHLYSKLVHGTAQQLAASCAGRLLLMSAGPYMGWPAKSDDRNRAFARNLLVMGTFSESISKPILERLARKAGYTVDELREQARADFLENAGTLRAAALDEVARLQALPLSGFVLDFTGKHPSPVHATYPGEGVDISASGAGITIVASGIEQYGAGFVSGTRYTVETVNTTLAATRTTSTASTTTDSSSSTTVSAQGGTQ